MLASFNSSILCFCFFSLYSTKDFLSDLLLSIKAGIELGQNVEIITYKLPDFYQELTENYMVSLQERKTATPDFVQECLMQTVSDFGI